MKPDQKEFLQELAYENPPPEEGWHSFDPPFPRSVVRPLEKRGWIETKVENQYVSHRFTPAGRAALAGEEK